jgi:hypothetical protein
MNFINELRHFSRSIDIVDESTYQDIKKLITDFFSEKLGFCFVEILKSEVQRNSRREILRTYWTFPKTDNIDDPVIDSSGNPTTQTSYSYFYKSGYWIVSKDKCPLMNANGYIDLWGSNLESIPGYQSANQFNIYTSVIVPIRQKNKIWGIINLESEISSWPNVLSNKSDSISKDINSIVEAFSTLTQLYEGSIVQRENTKLAIEDLKTSLRNEKPKGNGCPKIFVASSNSADEEVLGLIRKVLDQGEFRNRIETVFWKDLHKVGDIREQIWNELHKCAYGICYFSEPNTRNEYPDFVDNPNVIFEAGFQHSKSSGKNNWIPIRESNSTSIPFDIAGNRILIVERLDNKSINSDYFSSMLTKFLREMLS